MLLRSFGVNRGEPAPIRTYRLQLLVVATILVIAAFVAGCTNGSDDESTASQSPTSSRADASSGRSYTAEWIVDAAAIGREPGYAYRFVEIVDDAEGVYFTSGPDHLSLQTPPEVVFCAGILQAEPRCASTERPNGTPNVLALGPSVIREWHPEQVYEVANYRRMDLIADAEPESWTRSKEASLEIAVECFRPTVSDEGTPVGLSLCYTSDDEHLLASVDMNGDDIFEVYLDRYEPVPDEDQLEIPFDVIGDAKQYEQLLVIFPNVPITPTPVPVDDDGNPLDEESEPEG